MTAVDAEILAVGSELLTPTKIDTNSLWLTDQLNALGVEVSGKAIVRDDRVRLTKAVRTAMSGARLVFITGGLGPTEDDVTRDAVASALRRGQSFRDDVCETIASRFRLLKRPMAEINKRQALVIDGAELMPNDRGTAPGQWIEHDSGVVALLPGPPGEMKAMFELQCLPRLQRMLPPAVIGMRFYRIACIGESDVDQKIGPVYTKYANPVTTILAGLADIHVLLRARASTAEQAEALLEEPCRHIEALLGDAVYSCCGEPLEKVVGDMLVSAGKTVAFAESLTGGTLAGRFSGIPGASRYFAGGMVAYTNELKQQLLGVPREMLEEHSAVSQPVAAAMAESVRERLHTDYGVSTTGYAGPDGGDERNPVGTVFVGIAGPAGTTVRRLYFAGDRERVRTLTGVWALDLLRRALHQ